MIFRFVPFTKGQMLRLVTRSCSTYIHVTNHLFIQKSRFLYRHNSVRDAFTSLRRLDGGIGMTLEWGKISGLLETVYKIMFGSPVYEQDGRGQVSHLVYSGVPEKKHLLFKFKNSIKIKERYINETTNNSDIGNSLLVLQIKSFVSFNVKKGNLFS